MRIQALLFPTLALLFGAGCSPQGPGQSGEDTISREAFIDVFFDLRVAALRTPGLELAVEDRDRILEARGVTEEDLEGFVEFWGEDPTYMEAVWGEIRERLQEARVDGGGERGAEDARGVVR